MPHPTLTYVTGNPHKVAQFQKYCPFPVAQRSVDLPEIQSLDLHEIVRHKAECAYAEIGSPVLIEDVAFVIAAMNGLPGPLVKWFIGSVGNEGICSMADGFVGREAWMEVLYAYYDGAELRTFSGKIEGTVAPVPR